MNKEYFSAIKEMAMIDQELRYMARPGPHKDPANYMVYLADQAHNSRVRRLLECFGYPNSEIVGKEGMKDFWIVIQHQDADIGLQEACLKNCDFALKEQAYLTDRVLKARDKPQMYGTQFYRNPAGRRVLYKIADEQNIDVRRKKMGLETLAEYVKSQKDQV